jgi:ABC-type cobalamin/Fe3+-siderophores transport system ATPase subunit
MTIEITLKNYRCFPDSIPARFQLSPGFTAFVGANNSGKTSLLRFLYEFRELFHWMSLPSPQLLQALKNTPTSFSFPGTVTDPLEVFHKENNRDLEIHLALDVTDAKVGLPPLVSRFEITVRRGSNEFTCRLVRINGPLDPTKGEIAYRGPENHLLIRGSETLADLTRLFEAFGILKRTLYVGAFRNAINIGAKQDYYDIHVGQAFIEAWKNFKSGSRTTLNEAAYRVQKDIQHIFGLSDLEINPGPNDQTLQLFLNERSFKLSEVGSGMAQFILVLANAAMKEPTYILLDEPELGLHPSLQLDFLTTLASYAPSGGVLFATHNIGLARASAERVYTLRKRSEFESQISPLESLPRLSEFLGELSFGGYKEIGFDKVLLVEGPTDVVTVQQLLRRYNKDHKVVLLPLGGNSMINGSGATETQLQELLRISGNIAALVDSEKATLDQTLGADREAFLEVCRKVGVHCTVLKRRAIENYWTERVVKKIMGPKYRHLDLYESLNDTSPQWAKADNWRMAREMTKEELEETDLGQFLIHI